MVILRIHNLTFKDAQIKCNENTVCVILQAIIVYAAFNK